MPDPVIIQNTTTREVHTFWDHLLDEDENGVIVETETFASEGLLAEGDLCDVHLCTLNSATKGVMKIARKTIDNDLVQNEATVLKKLFPEDAADEKFYRYLPRVLYETTFEGRQVNVFPHFSEHVSFEAIRKAYPDGISHLDVAWMYKRLLVAIGFAHVRDYVHGAVLPPHFLVHPVDHGGRLIDWSYSVELGSQIRAISSKHRDFYPPEVFEKKPSGPSVDIYMAAKCVVYLLGGDVKTNSMPDTVPKRLQAFLLTSLSPNPVARPPDAWFLHEEFDKILREVVGPRSYRLFKMPSDASEPASAP